MTLLEILVPLLIGVPIAAFLCIVALVVSFGQPEIASSEDVGVRHADAPSQTNDSPGSAHGFRPNYASAPGAFSGGLS